MHKDDKIVSIEYIGNARTIDITTDGNHLFYGNGILTHNSSYENVEFDPSHISGGISKVNTADNVFGIFTSPAMRDGGRYQIQFMKTRSSSGVGSRVDLSFNIKSLRISDLEDGDPDAIAATTSTIYERIKNKSVIKTTEKTDMTTGEISKILPEVRKVDPLEGAAALRAFIKNR